MENLPSFPQRFGFMDKKPLENDFPESARKGLVYVLHQLVVRNYVQNGWQSILIELARSAREDFHPVNDEISAEECSDILKRMPWHSVYSFCERVYCSLLKEAGHWDGFDEPTYIVDAPLVEVREYFSDEMNNLLSEENIGFQFVDGIFQRAGRVQTQKNINKVNSALADPRLIRVRQHYNKAHRFYTDRERPDFENCVKEAVCALEVATEILSGAKVSQDFPKEVTKLSGNEPNKIPTPIAQSMIKIFAYRGAGQGISHGTTKGIPVTRFESELVLSIVAAYITYLVDFYESIEPEFPF